MMKFTMKNSELIVNLKEQDIQKERLFECGCQCTDIVSFYLTVTNADSARTQREHSSLNTKASSVLLRRRASLSSLLSFIFSSHSAPRLSSLSSLPLSDVRRLGERLLGNDCSHLSAHLSIHCIHPSSDSWLRSRRVSRPLCSALLKHHGSSCRCLARAGCRFPATSKRLSLLLKLVKTALSLEHHSF